MKYSIIWLLSCGYLFSAELTEYDFYIAKNFVKVDSIPEIIQEKEYVEGLMNKIDYHFSVNKPAIQGLYSGNKIYIYDLKNITIDINKKSCINVERFLKTGYLVHELTHYKQDLNNEKFKKTTDYISSEKEFEAFDNQLEFWVSKMPDENINFKDCFGEEGSVWLEKYTERNSKTHEVFELYNYIN